MRRSATATLLCAVLAACGDDLRGDGGDNGGRPAEISCRLSLGCPDWLEEYQREVVGSLTGERPIGDDLLASRATAAQRDLARQYLSAELSRLGLEPLLHDYAGGGNPYAVVPATTGGDARIVVGAHFDSVDGAPGAADNASGVALVLAAARYLVELERRDHAVMLVFFDQEELGLVGSQAFAQALRIDGTPVESVHNFDMLSWDEDDDRGVELWAPDAALDGLYRAAAAEIGMPVAAYQVYGSDHAAFLAQGYAAVGVGEEFNQDDTTPHYHRPGDSYDKVDFAYLGAATQLAVRALERQLGAASSEK